MTITPINERSLSKAWLRTVQSVAAQPDRRTIHTVTCIEEPALEIPGIRAAADDLSRKLSYQDPETVANTIFPAAMARSSESPDELAARYQGMYKRVRALAPANNYGTYFGRIVAYPSGESQVNQLKLTVDKLRKELVSAGPKRARYEINLEHPDPDPGASVALPIRAPAVDNRLIGFPCLSLCSMQLAEGRLHMVAHYRSQYLISKGYGNYLGLGRLLEYVADCVSVDMGQLTVIAGYAQVDASKARVSELCSFETNESGIL